MPTLSFLRFAKGGRPTVWIFPTRKQPWAVSLSRARTGCEAGMRQGETPAEDKCYTSTRQTRARTKEEPGGAWGQGRGHKRACRKAVLTLSLPLSLPPPQPQGLFKKGLGGRDGI